MDDTRFFSMKQLWQSLAISIGIGAVVVFIASYAISSFGQKANTQAVATTTMPAAPGPLPAAVGASAPIDPFSNLQLSGQAAIVVDLSTGQTLYTQNADAQLPLASLTKLLTIYGAQSVLTPSSPVTITDTALAQDGDYGFSLGETFAYKDIARLALTSSSNDAAEAIAEAAEAVTGQTSAQFMARAIQAAKLMHTKATNGTGLDIDATEAGAYGSARDIAQLAEEFVTAAPDVSKATTKRSVTIVSDAGVSHSLSNTNPDVASLTGLLLSKTGYTDLAGGNLAIVFDAGIAHPVAIVVLGSTPTARFTDVEKLMHATLTSFRNKTNP
ncbi:MAG: serine-type D-Ala-D-Ala carboxypeptidase D-alanyl-D-alanine carboxypeptidase [Parcubacteria group bacterium]|nr:serine-type D-Ala-D-Ala carboxypeptidase D-alanyl-D-alanine carboxypeptidase [Parcubacteria group bacterium]